jgi:vitamin B12 transporter
MFTRVLVPRGPRYTAFGVVMAFSSGVVHSQSSTLAPVVVTATREPISLDRVVSDVVVIDAQRIRDSSADSIEDLLRREAGMQLSRNGGPGQNASVLLRGNGANNTLVLIDGVRVGSATLGQTALEGISLAQVERIEVLRGPGSSLFGADAVGGVIQIITRRGEGPPRLSGHAAVGELKSREGSVVASGGLQGVDYAASLSRESSDGVSAVAPGDRFGLHNPDRDGFERTTGSLRLGLTPLQGHRVGLNVLRARLRSQFDSAEFNLPTFAPDPSPDFRNKLDTRLTALDYRGTMTKQWTTSVQLAQNDDELTSGATSPDRFDTRRRQLTWQNALRSGDDHESVIAIERLTEDASSTSFTADRERRNTAVVLGHAARFGRQLLQADVRHDRSSVWGGVTTGKAAWGWEMKPGLQLRAAAGTAFRAPSFNELYFPGFGVETLQPERSRNVEVGLNWRAADSSAGVTLYRNRVTDMIVFEPDRSFCPADPSYDFGCARNVGRARLQGVTFSAAHRSGDFDGRVNIDLLDAKDLDTGQRLTRRAAHQVSVIADYQRDAWWFSASLLGVGARPDGGVRLGAYETIDLQVRYRINPMLQLEAKLLNALDEAYQPARDYQPVGRQAWIGVRFDSVGL